VRASVTLDYDASASDETQETYDPNQSVTLSMQRTEQSSGPQTVPSGIPGTASNAPNTQALPVYPRETTPPQTAKSESGTYGVSKSVRHSTQGPGRVRRLTAAIVVNDRQLQRAQKNKAAVWQPRSQDEIRNLTAIAQAAVGFDPQRGDMVTVQDLSFDGNRPPEPVSPFNRALSQAQTSPLLVKYAAVLLGLLVVMGFGVRPALRRATPEPSAVPEAETPAELPSPAPAEAPALNAPEPPPIDPERQRAQEIFEQVTGQLKSQPSQSSRLLQSWIHSD